MFACPICTAWSRHRALCPVCAAGLWARREPVTRDLGAYRTHGLFAWRRDDWLGLRWWTMALKGKEHPAFWREPATWMLDVFGAPKAGTVLVPIPGARLGRNHALGFARALGAWAGLAVADVLRPRAARKQRRLGAFARRERRFDLMGDWPRGPVVIVDDVITSGATVEAAYRALGQPPAFAAWCLMDRRPPGEGALAAPPGR